MEHRWYQRTALARSVLVASDGTTRIPATLRDVSRCGLFVETPVSPRIHSRVAIDVRNGGGEPIRGFVVHASKQGFGLESEPLDDAMLKDLRNADRPPYGASGRFNVLATGQ